MACGNTAVTAYFLFSYSCITLARHFLLYITPCAPPRILQQHSSGRTGMSWIPTWPTATLQTTSWPFRAGQVGSRCGALHPGYSSHTRRLSRCVWSVLGHVDYFSPWPPVSWGRSAPSSSGTFQVTRAVSSIVQKMWSHNLFRVMLSSM